MTTIPIERLTTGTVIYVPALKSIVEVADIQFDGYGYDLTVGSGNWSDSVYVEAGGCVDFAGVGEPVLRQGDLPDAEEHARGDAIGREIDRAQGKINELQGHVCQPIDQRSLVAAVANALQVA